MFSNAKNTSKQTTINVLHLYHQYKHLHVPLSGSGIVIMMSLLCSMLQEWFADSAHMIAKAGHLVEKVTPLGMPVVQPYHKEVIEVSLTVYFVSSIYTLCLLLFTLVVAHLTPACSEKE